MLNPKLRRVVERRGRTLSFRRFSSFDSLPAALLQRLALRFLSRENSLPLDFRLACDLGETIRLGLARRFGRFRSQTRSKLRFFLADAFGLFFLTAALGSRSLFSAQPGFFTSLRAGGRKIAILGSVKIGP